MPRRSNRGQRGAASMEALILIPFFFTVWGCIFFAHRVMEKKIVANEIGRRCAWEAMSGGCSTTPPECNFSGGQQLSDDDLQGSRALVVRVQFLLQSFAIDFQGMFGPAFRPIFGAQRSILVNRPSFMGGGQLTASGSFSEMCNEVPGTQNPNTVSSDAYCRVTGWCP